MFKEEIDWAKQRWPRFFYILGIIYGIIRIGGDIQFVLSQAENINEINENNDLLDLVYSPSIWLDVIIILGFITLIFWDINRYKQLRPDYDKWDKKENFRLFEASCLWNEEEPDSRTSNMSLKSRRTFKRLRDAIKNKKLSISPTLDEAINMAVETHFGTGLDEDAPVNVNTFVGRDALTTYAKTTKKRPKFLFKGMRP